MIDQDALHYSLLKARAPRTLAWVRWWVNKGATPDVIEAMIQEVMPDRTAAAVAGAARFMKRQETNQNE